MARPEMMPDISWGCSRSMNARLRFFEIGRRIVMALRMCTARRNVDCKLSKNDMELLLNMKLLILNTSAVFRGICNATCLFLGKICPVHVEIFNISPFEKRLNVVAAELVCPVGRVPST